MSSGWLELTLFAISLGGSEEVKLGYYFENGSTFLKWVNILKMGQHFEDGSILKMGRNFENQAKIRQNF